MRSCISRRKWLAAVAGAAAATLAGPRRARATSLPTAPVAVASLKEYKNDELVSTLATMFDQLGGLNGLVSGKTVAIKINLVGDPWSHLDDLPLELTHWTHPAVIGATTYLLGAAGAQRIRIIECGGEVDAPLEAWMTEAGWNPDNIRNAAPNVEFENTSGLGAGEFYSRITCPAGHIFPGYDVNHSYTECDVFISMPKMKEHHWFGATLSMKNCYGMTPLTIYGNNAGIDEPGTDAGGTRVAVLHNGDRAPSLSAPQEIDPTSARAGDYRIPRIVADIASARPVDLAIVDGIQSMAGGEGPWYAEARPVSPGVLVAGLNAINTDAVALSVMGFDPLAERGTAPFEGCDNFLAFAEELGLGTRNLEEIEVVGTPIADVRFDFRNASPPPAP